MCRLFGLSAAPNRVSATFWLLDAPDSLAAQSRREPGRRRPRGVRRRRRARRAQAAASPPTQDAEFAREARELQLEHVRGARPLRLDRRARAAEHPPVRAGRPALRAQRRDRGPRRGSTRELGDATQLVARATPTPSGSSRSITREIAAPAAATSAPAIVAAARWVAAHLPLYALNLVLTTPTELWALRYPDTHELWVLERAAGGPHGDRHLEHASARRHLRVRSGDLAAPPAGGRRQRADGRGPGLAAARPRRAAARRPRPRGRIADRPRRARRRTR